MQNTQNTSAAMVALLAASCGIVVANTYYSQPLIGLIGPSVHMGAHEESLIVSLTQLGYALGLLLLVPLGDLVENRLLVVVTIATSIPALLLAGFAHSSSVMLVAGALIGITSVAVQMLIPMAAHLAPEHRRGRVVGTVTSGLLFGILLARPAASIIADVSSWRVVFYVSAGLMAVLAAVLSRALPRRVPVNGQHYGALLVSVLMLPVKLPVLRQRAAYQAACFAGFTLFWTGVPLYLAQDFGFTQRGIAIFGLAGAAGAFAAPIAGSLGDRGYARPGTAIALASIALAFGIAWFGGHIHSVVVLAFSGILLDAGVQTCLVLGQRTIYTMAPDMRSRLNGVFMAMFFMGGAAGSAVTSTLLLHAGWPGLCALGGALPLVALGYFVIAR